MTELTEPWLDRWLAAAPLPAPPPELTERARREMTAAVAAGGTAQRDWLARLQVVRQQFRELLQQPQFASLALVTRGSTATGQITDDDSACLGQVVQERCVRGQVFLTALESPAGLEILLLTAPDGAMVESTTADELGRFRFLNLDPGPYELVVPELDLRQTVAIPAV